MRNFKNSLFSWMPIEVGIRVDQSTESDAVRTTCLGAREGRPPTPSSPVSGGVGQRHKDRARPTPANTAPHYNINTEFICKCSRRIAMAARTPRPSGRRRPEKWLSAPASWRAACNEPKSRTGDPHFYSLPTPK